MALDALHKFSDELTPFSVVKLLSFVLWTNLYIAVTVIYPEKSPEWASRVITSLHGTVASACGIAMCGRPCMADFFTRIGLRHYALMVWSWGYFSFDLLWCSLYWPKQIDMLVHHVCTLLAIHTFMTKKHSGCIFPCTMALMEVTNPLLQARWFLRDAGFEKTTLFVLVEITYLSLFIILRGGVGTYIVVKAFMTPDFATDEKLLMLVLYIISLVFLYQILGYAWYKYKRKIVSHFQTYWLYKTCIAEL